MKKLILIVLLGFVPCLSFGQSVPATNPQTFSGVCDLLGLSLGSDFIELGSGNGNNTCDASELVASPDASVQKWNAFGIQRSLLINTRVTISGVAYGLAVDARVYNTLTDHWGTIRSCADAVDAVNVPDGHHMGAYLDSTSTVTVYDNNSATSLTCTVPLGANEIIGSVQAVWFKQ